MTQIYVGDLFMDTVHADVIFVVEGKEIPGHRLVLAKTCDYFEKLLFGDFLESKSKKVEVSGVSAKVFEEVMRFTYKEQLEVKEWTIEDLMSLLAVAHEYQFWSLFSAVIQAVEEKPLDFESWALVNSASSVYDSQELRRKCASFADEKIDDFICEKDLEKFSADLICCMFDRPKMFSFNQDLVVKSICKWKHGRSSTEVMCVLQKINWEKVSPNFTAVVLRELLSTVNNVENHRFWIKLSSDLDGQYESQASIDYILRVDNVVLKKNLEMQFALPKNEGNMFCKFLSGILQFYFKKDFTYVEIPVKRVEIEASTKFNIKSIYAPYMSGGDAKSVVTEPSTSNGWLKYSAVFPDLKPVHCINIFCEDFITMPEISLRSIIIW